MTLPHPGRRAARIAAGFLCLLAVAGCKKETSGAASAPSPGAGSGNPSAAAAPAGTGPQVIKVTPEQLAADFSGDDAAFSAAHHRYSRGVIEITGIVEEVGVNMAGDAVVALRAGPRRVATATAPAETPVVRCSTTDAEPWARVARGQEVTLRGQAGYLAMASLVKDADITHVGPATVATASAADLSGERAAAATAFASKYADRNLIVTGKVTESKPDLAGAITLTLDGGAGTPVRCQFGMIESTIKKTVAAVQPGQTVKVFGELAKEQPASAVALTSCRLITK